MSKQTKNRESVKRDAELVCVRHIATGLYLVATQRRRINAYGADDPADLTLTWNEQDVASVMTRPAAERTAAAYIALSGDSGVEIEAVVEEMEG